MMSSSPASLQHARVWHDNIMNLYLVRHAESRGIGGSIVRDADRPLTAEGEQDALLMGKALARIAQGPTLLAASPLVRATRTMELLSHGFAVRPPYEVWDELSPGISYRGLLAKLAARGESDHVLVGHQPDMTNFLAYLVADAAAEIVMPPCAVASLSIVAGGSLAGARLDWLLTPALVRQLQAGSSGGPP